MKPIINSKGKKIILGQKKNVPTEKDFDNMKSAEKDKLIKQLLKDKGLLR